MRSFLIAAVLCLLSASAHAETWVAADWALQPVECRAECVVVSEVAVEDACLRCARTARVDVPFWQRTLPRRILSRPWRVRQGTVAVSRRPFWWRGPLRRLLSFRWRR